MSPFSVFPITFLLSSPYRLLDHFIQLLMTLWLHIPHTTLYWPVSLVYAIPFTWNSLPLLLWKIASLSVSSKVPLSMTFEHSLALWTVSQDQCALQVYKPWLKRGLECVLMLCFHCRILTSNFQGFFVQKICCMFTTILTCTFHPRRSLDSSLVVPFPLMILLPQVFVALATTLVEVAFVELEVAHMPLHLLRIDPVPFCPSFYSSDLENNQFLSQNAMTHWMWQMQHLVTVCTGNSSQLYAANCLSPVC